MPENNSDTRFNDPVRMPPGFEELPAQDKMFLYSNRNDPAMLAIYQSTKTLELHQKHDNLCKECIAKHTNIDKDINSLKVSRSRAKWWVSGFGAAFTAIVILKEYIKAKIFG